MQLTRFAIVGAVATVVQYGVLIALVEIISMGKPISAALGYGAGGAVNYYLNLRWTFTYAGAVHEPIIRFFGVFVIGLALTWLLMFMLATKWDINYLLSQALTTGFVFGVNYLLHRTWTFSNERSKR